MRKAEEIIYNHYGCRSWKEVCKDFLTDISPSMIKEIVVRAQINAIEETCKRCAEEAEVKAQYKRNLKGSRYRTWKDESEVDLFSTTQKYSVNKQSILKVADKMKEELE